MRIWGPLVAVCLGTFMLLLDVTIVVVALADMARALGASLTALQWVIDGYALALAAALLGAGAVADALGRRRVHLVGVAVFAGASLACGLATSPLVLVSARVVQGLGAAAMLATTLPLLGAVYRGRQRSAALGVWGAVNGAAAAIGPVLGGLLTEGPGWRWIFFINLPVSVLSIWLTRRTIGESQAPQGVRLDWPGAVSFACFAAATTYAVVHAGARGWASWQTLGLFAVAALALLAFVLIEGRAANPLVNLALFRSPAFTGVLLSALACNAAAFAVLPYVSIWLQTLLGLGPLPASLAVLPLAATAFLVSAGLGRLLHGVSPALTIGGGLVLVGAGALAQATLGADSSWVVLLPGLFLAGLGIGLISPALAGAALAAVPAERAGMASGAVNTLRQLGYAIGIALSGTLLTSAMTDSLTPAQAHALAGGGAAGLRAAGVAEETLRQAFASGLNSASVLAGVIGVVAGIAALVLIRAPRAADRGAPVAAGHG